VTTGWVLAMAPAQTFEDLAAGLLAQAVIAGLVGPGSVADLHGSGVALRTGAVLTGGTVADDNDVVLAGVRPTVWFQLTGEAAGGRWLALTALVLDVGDTVLRDPTGALWLVRRDGELLLSDDDAHWPADSLDRVPHGWGRVPLG
jgi:hypothetical protein